MVDKYGRWALERVRRVAQNEKAELEEAKKRCVLEPYKRDPAKYRIIGGDFML